MKQWLTGFFSILLFSTSAFAHEQWLLTHSEIIKANDLPQPLLFTSINVINSSLIALTILGILFWILLNIFVPQKMSISKAKINWSVNSISFATGLMLILCSLGLIPKVNVAFFQQPVLLASDLLISNLGPSWSWLKWLQFIIGIALLAKLYLRITASFLLGLIILGVGLFGKAMLQYVGFYFGIFYFLMFTDKDGKYFLGTLKILQIFTGLNFLYSAISVKWLHPNVDIFMIIKHQAFTFGIPEHYFVFLMLIVEISFGLLIILGYRLRLIASLLFLLFVFMSFNFSENFFSHSFIYGILLAFIITNGTPLISRKS